MNAPDSDILAALRSDLLRGNLSNLAAHLAALTELEARLSDHAGTVALAALRAEADRNRDVLAAAAAGVRAALRRLGEAGAPAAIYAPDGRRVRLGTPAPGNESRA
jgi:hypothetical protein